MSEKKPESLADNLSSSKKYHPAPELNASARTAEVEKMKTKLDNFKKKVLKKFPFTKSLAILPPNANAMFEEDEAVPKEIIQTKPSHVLMIIPEEEYKNLAKIRPEIVAIVKESGENLWVHIKSAEVDMWNYGLDSKYEFIDAISAAFPLHDDGFLGALRVVTIHKNLVLNWLNVGRVRYVATYVIGGSLVRGAADKTSDIDTFVIIDDTDVKRMSRVELLEKLRGRITNEFVKEAIALAGVKNSVHVQVYLLTDFWQSVKDAQPVMFTFIRDGIPLFDRGTFIPWKRLLQMGRIKPSPEAIDLYMKEGERTEELVKRRLMDAMIDIYYGVVTPTQALMMLAGKAPPVPKTMVAEVKQTLVDELKIMSMKELKTVEKLVKHFKDYEHGRMKEIPGKEIDALLEEFKEYTKKIKDLRAKLEKKIQDNQGAQIYETTFSLLKKLFGDKSDDALIKEFEKELVKKGKISERMLSVAKEISQLKAKTKSGKLTSEDIHKLTKDSFEFFNSLTEYAQRKDLVSLEKGVLQVSFEKGKAELVFTESATYIVEQTGKIDKLHGSEFKESSKEDLEKSLANFKSNPKSSISSELFTALKKKFGDFTISF